MIEYQEFYVVFFALGAIMILSASREFDRNRNPLIIDRESDNVELPKVCILKRKIIRR
jgi:hypothetical protein